MGHPEIRKELKPYEDQLTAAAIRGDMVEFRRIVEEAGVAWVEYEMPEKDRYQGDIQKLRQDLGLPPNPFGVCRVLIEAAIPDHPAEITPEIEREYWEAGDRGDIDRCREIIEVYGVHWQCRYKTVRCAGCPGV